MAKCFVDLAQEQGGPRVWPEKERDALPPPLNLRRADAKEPRDGARWNRVDRVVQWMAETPRALLLYDFDANCHYWLPRWLWPKGAGVEMQGEAGPVGLPRYFVERLGL